MSYLSWYIRSGRVKLKTHVRTYQLSAGDWIFIDPLTFKSHHFSPKAHIISIRFTAAWQGMHFIPPLAEPRVLREGGNTELLEAAESLCAFKSVHVSDAGTDPPSIKCRLSALFSQWLYHWHLLREQTAGLTVLPIDNRIYGILSALGDRPKMGAIDYDRLRHVVGLSRAQIDRVFKEATGLTPRQWCEAYCLQAVEDCLRVGELSVKEIAAKLGFFDASHFTKWFRAKMGVTPTAWREM